MLPFRLLENYEEIGDQNFNILIKERGFVDNINNILASFSDAMGWTSQDSTPLIIHWSWN